MSQLVNDPRLRMSAERGQFETNSFCEDVSKYKILAKVGQGTFGEVSKAINRITKEPVALKKILMDNEKDGFPVTALREVRILQQLKHKNVVNLIEICKSQDATGFATFFIVFEFCEHDLAGLLCSAEVKFSLGDIKSLMKQLLEGLYFIHRNKILHRDLKASNILITKSGCVKLADFGLARALTHQKDKLYTNRVVTLWYRPPELLLGERKYGSSIDMWGAGCIMAELWTRCPIMQGATEQKQLYLISELCGSICPKVWPGVEKLDLYSKIELPTNCKRKVKDKLRTYIKDNCYALDMIDKLLTLDPSKRPDADTILNHDFFWTDPMPSNLSSISKHEKSMYELFTSRRQQLNSSVSSLPPHKRVKSSNNEYHDRIF